MGYFGTFYLRPNRAASLSCPHTPMTVIYALLLSMLGLVGPGSEPFRALELDAAVQAARLEKKCVLVVFGRAGAPDARKLDSTTWVEPKVREWLASKAVPIKIDVDAREDVSSKYRIHIVPTIVFLNSSGVELDRITGYVDGRAFRPEADAILNGGDPVERVRKRLVGHELDPHLRIDLAGALCDRGLLAESLAEYMWCWDHGLEANPAFGVDRRAFLLREILRLSRVYPPAGDALALRAHDLFERVSGCDASGSDLDDFLALDRLLQQDDRTLAAYDGIASSEGACAAVKARLAPHVVDPMIDVQRYQEAITLLGDVGAHFKSLALAFDDESKRLMRDRPNDASALIDVNRRRLRIDAARLYEALLGALRYDEAESLAKRIFAFDERGATYTALVRAALRVEAHGQARSIAVRAYGNPKLTDAEKLEVKSAAREILQPK